MGKGQRMTVDIRLNQMVDALDAWLKTIPIEETELSIRTFHALKKCGVNTLHDAQVAIINRQLHKQYGIGPKAVKEVEEIIRNVSALMPPLPPEQPAKSKRERKLENVLEMFLSWTGALAQVGSANAEAWRELVAIRARAEAVLDDD